MIAISALVFAGMSPLVAQAALTNDQISSVVGLLQSFNVDSQTIATVKATLNGTPLPHPAWSMASTTHENESGPAHPPPGQEIKMQCLVLGRNLSVGSEGKDVRALQEVLANEPSAGFTGTTTGFFGPMTAQALRRFQEHNAIATSSSGVAGPLTRAFLNRRCGVGIMEHMGSTTPPGQARPMPMVAPQQ